MATVDEKDKAARGMKARRDAMNTLIANHKDEFEELVVKNRVALGLPLKPQGPTPEELEERIRKQEAKLSKWRKQLEQSKGGASEAA